ncbi:hypothetical protein ACILE2_11120 [Capnocytophaga canimorsus]|uniref:hypothetical protein n=1 Tax=Capnocytophaga canimorsus TaxID=28188 RepID=UPI0037D77793
MRKQSTERQIASLKEQIADLQRELARLEGPENIIGAKVVYNEKYLKRLKKDNDTDRKLPECGYFVITKARLQDDGRVMVQLDNKRGNFLDDTHISLGNLKMYEPQKTEKL